MTVGPSSVFRRRRRPSPSRHIRLPVLVVLCVLGFASIASSATPSGRPDMIPVAGGTAPLLRLAGIRVPVEPARAFLVLVPSVCGGEPGDLAAREALATYLETISGVQASVSAGDDHGFLEASGLVIDDGEVRAARGGAAARRRQLLLDSGFPVDEWMRALNRGERLRVSLPVDRVPAFLPPAVWERAVFQRAIPSEGLAAAIAGDRRAALLYYGLHSLDDETLAFLAASPSVVSSIYREAAAAFAAFAESVTVEDGRVTLPGAEQAASIWEAFTGAPASQPARFIPALLARDDGRFAWFFDTVAHLDRTRQVYALGLAADSAEARLALARSLYATFARFQRRAWSIDARPFSRSPVDPAFVLHQLAVRSDGRMAEPGDRSFWEAVLGERGEAEPGRGEADAGWLLERLSEGSTVVRRARLTAVLFAQRLMSREGGRPASEGDVDLEALRACTAAFPAHQMLLVSLERLGVTRPQHCTAAVRAADALVVWNDPRGSATRLALFQGALALLARAERTGALAPGGAEELATSLFELPLDPGRYPSEAARWIETRFIPSLARRQSAAAPTAIEEVLIDSLAGVGTRRPGPIVEWEGRRYVVDPAASDRARLQRIRRRQGGATLDEALEVAKLVAAVTDPDCSSVERERAARALADRVGSFRPGGGRLFGFPVTDLLGEMVAAAGQVPADRSRLDAGLGAILSGVLASHVYATAIGDADSAVVLAGDPASSHDFGIDATPDQTGPWDAAVTVRGSAAAAVRGSLLGLESALGFSWLRATTQGLPARVPSVDPQDAHGFGESIAALGFVTLDDAARDWILQALHGGRLRLAESSDDEAELDRLLARAGVERWRRRLFRSLSSDPAEGGRRYLSLGEVISIGARGPIPPGVAAWGLNQRALDGSLQLHLPLRLHWHLLAGRKGAALLPARMADAQLRVLEHLAVAGLPSALVPGVAARVAWDVVRDAGVAGPDDWLPIIRAAQALSFDQVADHVAALTYDGPLVPVPTDRRGRGTERRLVPMRRRP